MKNMIIALAFIMAIPFQVSADNDRAIPYGKLPEKAKMFISANFPDGKLAYLKQERDFLEVHYEVVLVSGVKIVFGRSGSWTEIECRYSDLDDKFIPAPVRKKVYDLYPDVTYRKISLEKNGLEVKLSNGVELTFDKNFHLVGID